FGTLFLLVLLTRNDRLLEPPVRNRAGRCGATSHRGSVDRRNGLLCVRNGGGQRANRSERTLPVFAGARRRSLLRSLRGGHRFSCRFLPQCLRSGRLRREVMALPGRLNIVVRRRR